MIKNDIITDVSLKLNEMTDKCINDLKNILINLNSLINLNLSGNYLSENNIIEIDKILIDNNNKNKIVLKKEENNNKKSRTSKKIKSNVKQTLILDSSDTDY
jgi:hypothetical protein